MAKKIKDGGLVWGIILVVLGGLFLIEQVFKLNIFKEIWQFWPVILIVWGAILIKNQLAAKK